MKFCLSALLHWENDQVLMFARPDLQFIALPYYNIHGRKCEHFCSSQTAPAFLPAFNILQIYHLAAWLVALAFKMLYVFYILIASACSIKLLAIGMSYNFLMNCILNISRRNDDYGDVLQTRRFLQGQSTICICAAWRFEHLVHRTNSVILNGLLMRKYIQAFEIKSIFKHRHCAIHTIIIVCCTFQINNCILHFGFLKGFQFHW